MAANRKVRMGVVGGRFGCEFQWHEHPNSIVEAVCDANPERRKRLSATYRCDKAYEDFKEMVRDPKIDAVAIFSQPPLHANHSVLAMEHGKHVLCAVPCCFGSIEEGAELLEAVKRTGMTYMMAETSNFRASTISAKKFYKEGAFGEILYSEAEYQHDGMVEACTLFLGRDWRYGLPPMFYPTHSTAFLISVTGERLTEVVCHGWGDDHHVLKNNEYKNPFWNETAMFRTDRGHPFRATVWWKGPVAHAERARWIGEKMSFYGEFTGEHEGLKPVIIRKPEQEKLDNMETIRTYSEVQKETYEQPVWWSTEMLPEPLRHDTAHGGSHTFVTHEFVSALIEERRPEVDIYEALAYTIPGIVAHQSALKDGERLSIPQFDLDDA